MKEKKFKVSYRAFIGKGADGKKKYKRFTGYSNTSEQKALEDAKKQAERWKALHEDELNKNKMTLREACDGYIASKNSILSPATIRGYTIIVKNRLVGLMNTDIHELTQLQIQIEMNNEAKKYSPKTVHNDHGFLSAVLALYRPEFILHTRLPEKTQNGTHVPSNAEIEALLKYIEHSDYNLYKAILLAAFGSLRRSEICALTVMDITDNVVSVNKAMVPNKENEYVIKMTTKSEAGTRLVTMPSEVIDKLLLDKPKDRIISLSPRSVTQRFRTVVRHYGFDVFRFHDLRHYQASILHAMGVPDQYIMARGGWKTDATLKAVYRHQMDEKRKEVESDICNYFSDKFQL